MENIDRKFMEWNGRERESFINSFTDNEVNEMIEFCCDGRLHSYDIDSEWFEEREPEYLKEVAVREYVRITIKCILDDTLFTKKNDVKEWFDTWLCLNY